MLSTVDPTRQGNWESCTRDANKTIEANQKRERGENKRIPSTLEKKIGRKMKEGAHMEYFNRMKHLLDMANRWIPLVSTVTGVTSTLRGRFLPFKDPR